MALRPASFAVHPSSFMSSLPSPPSAGEQSSEPRYSRREGPLVACSRQEPCSSQHMGGNVCPVFDETLRIAFHVLCVLFLEEVTVRIVERGKSENLVRLCLSEVSTFSVSSLNTGTLARANMVAIEIGSRLSKSTFRDFDVFTTCWFRSVNICCTR